ncbi:MAG: UDP-N-acetylmuramoyl-tripeptide--D-alanyl-D-alanine ligase [Cyclobacteriaceae bacterium]
MINRIEALYDHFRQGSGISTDTRKIEKGNLFFALKGPNFDGNQYADKALQAGAGLAVVDDESRVKDSRFFCVNDVLKALQQLATHHRNQFNIPIIGLTGSNGKTTSKELINAVLSKKYQVLATRGNLNNHIGVPLTLLELKEKTQMAIIEMGANRQGEIMELCQIAGPTHGFITNIGKAHLEGMGGAEGVLKTKTELFQFLLDNGGKVFINTLQPIFNPMRKWFSDAVLFPGEEDFCPVKFMGADPYVKFSVNSEKEIFTSQLIGDYNFDNLAAALCFGKFFKVPMQEGIDAVCRYTPENMRSQLVEKRSNLIILDAYNANPSSMEAALKAFDSMNRKKQKMVILGDMLELGEDTKVEHEKLGEILNSMAIDKICLTGKLIHYALPKVPKALYFPDPFSLRNWLQDSKLENHQILIKGSRGMKLEGFMDFI